METIEQLTAEAEKIFHTARNQNRELTVAEQMRSQQIFADIRAMRALASQKSEAVDYFARHSTAGGASRAEMAIRAAADPMVANAERQKYNRYLATGERGERDNFVITTGVDSGALVPVSVDIPDIVRRPYNSIRQAVVAAGYAPIMTATAETLVIPVGDDSSVFGQSPAENATADTAADPSVSDVTLGATLFGSKSIWLSNTMILTVGYDLVGYLMPIVDKRVELAQDAAWITKLLAVSAGGNTKTTASATAFTYDELVEAYHTVNFVYRSDAVWIVSDGFLQAIRLLKDSENRPIFNMLDPLVNAGAIGSLMGRPVVISNNMQAMTAGNIPACLASAECLKVRFVTNRRIARYSNIPTYPDQVGFQLFENADAGFNAAGIAFLKMAAS